MSAGRVGDDFIALLGGSQDSSIAPPPERSVIPDPGPPASSMPKVLTANGARGPLSGEHWPGYEIGDLLGCGGMAEVYRAWQVTVGRIVALKAMPAGIDDPGLRARFSIEVAAAARIDSPYVVRVHDSGQEGGRMWLAMEYVAGRSLAELIRDHGALPPAKAGSLVLQAARGLAVAHAMQLVHRDIKPANLLLSAGGSVKVADFGLVRVVDGRTLTRTGTILGTPQYLAPEQGRGLATGPASDIYSLGAVLYELLTGRPPFQGETADSLIFQHNFAEPPLPAKLNPDVPADLQAVCVKCLQKDPLRRYINGTALVEDLARVLDGKAPASAVFATGELGTGAAEALRRAGGRRRRWLPPALVLTLVACGGLWWWMSERHASISELRSRLAPVALAAPLPATTASDLDRLESYVGAADPLIAAGRRKLDAIAGEVRVLDAAIAGNRSGEVANGIDRLVELVGRDGDPRLDRWRGWLAGQSGRLEELRHRLAPELSGHEALPRSLRDRLGSELSTFLAAAPASDPDALAWRQLLERSDAAAAALRQRLGRCADPSPLSLGDLTGLAAACEGLAALAGSEAVDPAWRKRIDGEGRDLAAAQNRLASFRAQATPSSAERAAASAAVATLLAHQALSPVEVGAVRDRLDGAEQDLAALALRLAVLDRRQEPPPDTSELLARYEALSGSDDPRLTVWRDRLGRIHGLQQTLTVLDQTGLPPEGSERDLDALAALVGEDQPAVHRWRTRLAAIGDLRRRIAVLATAAGPLPADADTLVAALAGLVGEQDALVRNLRQRISTQRQLEATLDSWPALVVLPDPAGAAAALARYRALAGDDDRAVRAGQRLAELRGPDTPPWAAVGGSDCCGPWCELVVDGVRIRLRWLPPVSGPIGSPTDEAGRNADETPGQVRLSRGRWIADRECPQGLWMAVMGTQPARTRDPALPVESVSASEAEEFCATLAHLRPGCAARLPSEAEWELAMRAGATGPYGAIPPTQAADAIVHCGQGLTAPRPAGSGPANPLGLHDGPGNVWEWCAGAYGPQPTGDPAVDPQPPPGPLRVARGGSWGDVLDSSRLARRLALDGATRSCYLGFRFVVDERTP